ncbi:MAG TPA: hypothetical protein PLO52_09400 [Flavobacterium alvei]|nr:hypothetical protein [Flavobacterium alvei]
MLITHDELEYYISQNVISPDAKPRKDGLLLTLGDIIQCLEEDSSKIIDPFSMEDLNCLYGAKIKNWDEFILRANDFVLFSTNEHINMGGIFYGFITTLTHVARLGLMTNLTSNFVDTTFQGQLILEIKNLTNFDFLLHKNMPVAKLLIFGKSEGNSVDFYEFLEPEMFKQEDELSSNYPKKFSMK